MNRAETLAANILATRPLLIRFVEDFDDATGTKQSEGLPNHVVWVLGHCALTMQRVAEHFDGKPLPDSDFIMGDGTQGDANRFDTESVCIESVPVDDPSMYPNLARSIEIFSNACDRFAEAVGNSPDEKFDEELPWHEGSMPLWKLVMRVCFHNGTHAGQLTDLRRALGMGRVIKPRVGGREAWRPEILYLRFQISDKKPTTAYLYTRQFSTGNQSFASGARTNN